MTALLSLLLVAGPAPQGVPAPGPADARAAFFGSAPAAVPTGTVLDLSLSDAIDRGLQHNLAALLAEQELRSAEGSRREALSELLPHVSGRLSASRQKISLEAFGFTGPGLPAVVGPFNVFDARAAATQTVLDFHDLYRLRAEDQRSAAARYSYQDTRDLVTLVCGNLYLATLAEESRIEAARAQLETARALHGLALDRKEAGLAPAVDAIRAEVELSSREQALIVTENRLARARLTLARAIGLPPGQEFRLTDRMPQSQAPSISVDAALQRAYDDRSDWKGVQALVRAAEASRKSAEGEGLPSVEVSGDYGAIGQTVAGARGTFTLGAAVRVPLFEGGKVKGKVIQADAALEASRARLEDMRGRVDFEVRTALIDLKAAAERVGVADRALALARRELEQARDRFEAGVANNLEVVQAQESVADATEGDISVIYDLNVAKAALARALGGAEQTYKELVRGN
jgi:outer membrane protein TolC